MRLRQSNASQLTGALNASAIFRYTETIFEIAMIGDVMVMVKAETFGPIHAKGAALSPWPILRRSQEGLS
jgi:hypothetical protein